MYVIPSEKQLGVRKIGLKPGKKAKSQLELRKDLNHRLWTIDQEREEFWTAALRNFGTVEQ